MDEKTDGLAECQAVRFFVLLVLAEYFNHTAAGLLTQTAT